MLKFLRGKKITKRILWASALSIAIGTIIWQADNSAKNKRLNSPVSINNNVQIAAGDFAKNLKNAQVWLFLNYFNQPDIFNKIKDDEQLLSQLAYQNLVLKNIAQREKITVSNKEVVNSISTFPLFNNKGKFNNKTYRNILKYNLDIIPRDFEEGVRNFIVISKLKENITKNVAVSEDELAEFYKNENEKVKLSYILIDKNTFKDDITVTENEIDAFYNNNKILFKDEEKEKASPDIANLIKNEKSAEFIAKKTAELYNELKSGNTGLAGLVKKHNLKLNKTELISRYDTIEGIGETYQIVENAFRLKPKEVSEPIKIKNDFMIIEPIEFKSLDEAEFKKTKEDYKNKALLTKKARFFDNWLKSVPINYSIDIEPENPGQPLR